MSLSQIQRRYSQFYKFRKFLSRINPRISEISFPPKKYFFNSSSSVVNFRQKSLQNFVNQILKLCEGFDTPEQDVIFRFLDGYENIQHSLRDTLSVGIWTDQIHPSQQSTSLPQLDPNELSSPSSSINSASQGTLKALFGFSSRHPTHQQRPVSTSSLALSDQRIWRTPLAAAVLSCCLLVISIMTQIQSSEHGIGAIE
jgi:hypothetical protein